MKKIETHIESFIVHRLAVDERIVYVSTAVKNYFGLFAAFAHCPIRSATEQTIKSKIGLNV
jgi:hypothetical protein